MAFKFVTRCALTLLFLSALPLRAAAQDASTGGVSTEDREAINALSKYIGGSASQALAVDQHLQSMGFTSAVQPPSWASFPTIRKLTYAYQAAEAHSPGGGAAFLAKMSSALAQKYDAAAHESAFFPFLRMDDLTKLGFKPLSAQTPAADIGPAERRAIVTLAMYLRDGNQMSLLHVLELHFDLNAEAAFDTIVRARSDLDALLIAASRLQETRLNEAISDLVETVETWYPAARSEEAFRPYSRLSNRPSFPDAPGDTKRPPSSACEAALLP